MEELKYMSPEEAAIAMKRKSLNGTKKPEWLTPIMLSALKDAVQKESKTVFLDGKEFNIRYGFKLHYPASDETSESVLLTPVRGFVPMGYIALNKILAA